MRISVFAAAATAVILSGCAYTSMDAKIQPDVFVQESQIGRQQTVGVVVVDERPTQDVGRRSAVGAKIKLKEDIAAIYQAALIDGLKRKGFDAQPGAIDGKPTLKVEVRSLAYDVSAGWWTGGIETDSTIKAYAQSVSVPYEQVYRSNNEDRTVIVPDAKSNNKKLNAVVSDTLQQLLNDQKLLETLAGQGAAQS